MNNLLFGVIGASLGIGLVVLANLLLLPFVLRRQREQLPETYRTPIVGWDRDQMGIITRLMYRFVMPVVFGLMGAYAAILFLGGGAWER